MLKVMTLVGTRPELIKMSRVISELDKHTDHTLVHTGQNYDFELNQIFFSDLEIRSPDFFLGVVPDANPMKVVADIIAKSDDVFDKVQPDALLLYGDTNSCLSVIPAKRRRIPVFHMEAGNRCFDERVPEELNRKVVDHLSDFNLVLTEHARRYLIAEGIRPETIIKTGSHMHEVLKYYMPQITSSDVLGRHNLEARKYFLVSIHREENVDCKEQLSKLIQSLDSLAKHYSIPIVVSTHPRTSKRLISYEIKSGNSLVRFHKPFGFFDYMRLQMNALCVLSDSGTIVEEATLLGFPAIILRETHERPEGMDAGGLIMGGLDEDSVLNAVRVILEQREGDEEYFSPPRDYLSSAVSKKVVQIVLSYTDYVNRTVWRKN